MPERIHDERLEGKSVVVKIKGLPGKYRATQFTDGSLMMKNRRTAPFIIRRTPCLNA